MNTCSKCGKERDGVCFKCINKEKESEYVERGLGKTISITFHDAVFKDSGMSKHSCNLCEWQMGMKRYIKLRGLLHPNTQVVWYLCRECFKTHIDMKIRE